MYVIRKVQVILGGIKISHVLIEIQLFTDL